MANGYPVEVRGYRSLQELLLREGDILQGSDSAPQATGLTNAPGNVAVGSTDGFGNLIRPSVGRALFLASVEIGCTANFVMRLQVGGHETGVPATGASAGLGQQPRIDRFFMVGPSRSGRVDLNVFLRSSSRPVANLFRSRLLDLNPSSLDAAGATVSNSAYFSIGTTGYALADSTNFDAKKVHLFIGDSIWNGTGPSTTDTCIPFLINQYYQNKGIDCRYILKAYSGSRSDGHERKRASGDYNFPQVDVIHYNLGMNDAGVLTTNQSMANVTAMVTWALARYPGVKIIIYGPTPRQDANESALVALRSAESAYVAGLNNSNVKFCDLGNSFDRTVFANYVSTDTSGSAVHPGDTGLSLEWNGGYNGNIGIKAWLDANLLRI